MFCSKCGRVILGESKFCSECGTIVNKESIESVGKYTMTKKYKGFSKLRYVAVVVVIALSIVACKYYIIMNNNKNEAKAQELAAEAIKKDTPKKAVKVEYSNVELEAIEGVKIMRSKVSSPKSIEFYGIRILRNNEMDFCDYTMYDISYINQEGGRTRSIACYTRFGADDKDFFLDINELYLLNPAHVKWTWDFDGNEKLDIDKITDINKTM